MAHATIVGILLFKCLRRRALGEIRGFTDLRQRRLHFGANRRVLGLQVEVGDACHSTNFILRMANTDMRKRSQPCLKRLMFVVP